MKRVFVFLFALMPFLLASGAGAVTVNFTDFTNTDNLSINANAHTTTTGDGRVLRLSSSTTWDYGSAFSTMPIHAGKFSTHFSFRISNAGGIVDDPGQTGADGIVFVVQNVSSGVGGAGQGIGYENIGTSVGVEFDTWYNSYNFDPNSNHVGINWGGNIKHNGNNGPVRTYDARFDDGDIWHSWIDYDGETLEVRVNKTGDRPDEAFLAYGLDIFSLLGDSSTAYVGFTSATGLAYGDHDILSWEYRDDYNPISAVPVPGPLLLLGSGLLGLVGLKRR